MAIAGIRLIGGVLYKPVDEYKGRKLLQGEPEPSTGHHSYCVQLIGDLATYYIGSEVHQLGYQNDTRGDLAGFVSYYRRLIDRYGSFGGDEKAVADFQMRVVDSIPRAVEEWHKQNS